MTRKDNIIYFDSDDEFLDFCVVQAPVIREGKHGKYIDFDLTSTYKNELEKGTRFCIKDEDSIITKRGMVSYRTESKEVQNLEPWFGIEF